jgi:hypothetical protein
MTISGQSAPIQQRHGPEEESDDQNGDACHGRPREEQPEAMEEGSRALPDGRALPVWHHRSLCASCRPRATDGVSHARVVVLSIHRGACPGATRPAPKLAPPPTARLPHASTPLVQLLSPIAAWRHMGHLPPQPGPPRAIGRTGTSGAEARV